MAADSKAKLLDSAERYVLHGKTRLAISEYLKIIHLDPDDVLILNTIGDLYLRLGNWAEAHKFFLRVADSYVHNNFLLKAIAVYKKILNSDPDNLEINTTMAALYVKQGLNLDACGQYMRVIGLLEKEGRSSEALSAYEKIVELDPLNSTAQQKLATLHSAVGAKEKAHTHWIGAARAQVKSKDLAGASNSYLQALQIFPLEIESIRGFLDCCLKTGNLRSALDQLQQSSEMAPQNPDIREMLGQVYLRMGDCESAAKAFRMAVSMDESCYENFFALTQALINKEAYDQAVECLDSILPILIMRRDTDRAINQYQLILQHRPKHLLTLIKLASLYSAIGDQTLYLDRCDELAEFYLAEDRPVEALVYIEKILHIDPENEKHLQLHRQAFIAGYPDSPYVPPSLPSESLIVASPPLLHERAHAVSSEEGLSEDIVEVDLFLNYGLKDKAFSILLNLEAKDPYNKEVRIRLISIYKAEGKNVEAAEQCLLLAALYHSGNNEEATQTRLAEAKQLAPELKIDFRNLAEFARSRGIAHAGSIASSTKAESSDAVPELDSEVDLSSDLMNAFFGESPESAGGMKEESSEIDEATTEGYPQAIPSAAPTKSLEEQFQEVDFYIRLGFNDEALSKLSEIARISPDNPELALRYEKLGQTKAEAVDIEPIFLEDSDEVLDLTGAEGPGEAPVVLQPLEALDEKDEFDRFLQSFADEMTPSQDPDRPLNTTSPGMFDITESGIDDMFADLIKEAGSANQDANKSSFEEHFSAGTAYREMELIEEAIKEFEIAFKSIEMQKGNPHAVQCCGMLSTCFLKKNMPESVLRWCRTGLSLTEDSSHEAMALRYDIGLAHSMSGSNEQALECFNEIFRLDSGYRDVAKKIDELKGGVQRHVP